MQAYQQKTEKFFVFEEKSFVGSATGVAIVTHSSRPIEATYKIRTSEEFLLDLDTLACLCGQNRNFYYTTIQSFCLFLLLFYVILYKNRNFKYLNVTKHI